VKTEVREQLEAIKAGTEDVLPEEELVKKLERAVAEGTSLRVKMGFDPSAPDIHLGHTVGLRKLRVFQDLGHFVVLIVGDYTGMIGDPSGQGATRPRLTYEEGQENARTYLQQFFKIVDEARAEIRWNGEWFSKMSFMEIMGLASRITVARMLERDDFEKRYREGKPISVHEFFYPLMQGYDSVSVESDVELGGTDQKFNLLMGRDMQEHHGQEPQVIVTVPILEGTDGVQRMSKTTGNYIGVDEPPREMFGKVMSIPDALILRYFELVTDVGRKDLAKVRDRLSDGKTNPRDVKVELAERLIGMYHSREAAKAASAEFNRIFKGGGAPDEMPEFRIKVEGDGITIIRALTESALVTSNSEARRKMTINSSWGSGPSPTSCKLESGPGLAS
jgi:tyrosyl-tRNA synthetase